MTERFDSAELLVLLADPDQPVPYTVADAAGKDTRDSHQLPAGASTLDSDVRDLLAGIATALDVPYPTRPDDTGRALVVLMNRAAVVRGVIEAVIGGTARPDCTGPPLRSGTDRHPVTYPTQFPAPGGEA